MHIDWNVSVGNMLTLATTLVCLVYGAGRMSQILTTLVGEIKDIKEDFRDHQEQNYKSFETINKSLMEIMLASTTAFTEAAALARTNATKAETAVIESSARYLREKSKA